MHRDRSPAVAHAVCGRAPTPSHREPSGAAPGSPLGELLSAHLENCCPPTWRTAVRWHGELLSAQEDFLLSVDSLSGQSHETALVANSERLSAT